MMPSTGKQPQAARLSKDAASLRHVRTVPVPCAGKRPAAAWNDVFDAPGIDIERNQPPVQERELRGVAGLGCEDWLAPNPA